MNCFTFEASFHGYISENRTTEEFTTDSFEKMGAYLMQALYEYSLIINEDEN
jgi:hypothetical protein